MKVSSDLVADQVQQRAERCVVSLVLGSYNRLPFLRRTIESIRRELRDLGAAEIIVIDGGSTDGSVDWLTKQKDVITIVQHNRGRWRGKEIERRSWGYFMNLGFKIAQGKFICMLSDDCLLVPEALAKGVELFEAKLAANEKVGAVAFYWRNWPEQTKYWVGTGAGHRMFVNHGLYLKQALEDVGYIDQENFGFYYADADLCLRMHEKGWRCIDSPESFVEHFTHANMTVRKSNSAAGALDEKAYQRRWKHLFMQGDPGSLGAWVELSHMDEHRTYRQFPRREIWLLRSRMLWNKIRHSILSPAYYAHFALKLMRRR